MQGRLTWLNCANLPEKWIRKDDVRAGVCARHRWGRTVGGSSSPCRAVHQEWRASEEALQHRPHQWHIRAVTSLQFADRRRRLAPNTHKDCPLLGLKVMLMIHSRKLIYCCVIFRLPVPFPSSLRLSMTSRSCCAASFTLMYRGGSKILLPLNITANDLKLKVQGHKMNKFDWLITSLGSQSSALWPWYLKNINKLFSFKRLFSRAVSTMSCWVSWCAPSKHRVWNPNFLFRSILSKKLWGLHDSVHKTIETVSPKLYNWRKNMKSPSQIRVNIFEKVE